MDGTIYQFARIRKPAPKGAIDVRATPPPTPEPPTNPTLEVIVGTPATHTYTRTWQLPRNLLRKTSSTISCLMHTTPSITLSSTAPQIFQIYLDYTHSSIYSINRVIPISPLRQHTDAWLLGSSLGSPEFCAAALRALHGVFELGAPKGYSCAARSPIKAEDVEYVCRESGVGSQLRTLYFDAVAAHWTRFEAGNVGSLDAGDEYGDGDVDMESSDTEDGEVRAWEKKVKWIDVYARYADFRGRMLLSLMFGDGRRDVLLRSAEEYVSGRMRGRKRRARFSSPVRLAVRRSTGEGMVMVTKSEEDVVEGEGGGGKTP